ncbi:MAG TPA: ATP-binding protein, partial [Acidobacteriota bacterium]
FVVSTVTTQTGEAESRWRPLVAQGLAINGQAAIDAYERDGREALAAHLDRIERRIDMRAWLLDDQLRELSSRELPDGGEELAREAASSEELVVREVEQGPRLVASRIITPEGGQYVMLAEIVRVFYRGGRPRDRADNRFRGVVEGQTGGRGVEGQAGGQGDETVLPDAGAASAADRGGFDRRGGPPRGPREARPPAWYWVWLSLIDDPGALAFRLLAVFLTAGLVCYGLARYLTAPVLRLRDATNRLAGGDLAVRVGPAVGNRKDELAQLGHDFDLMAARIESLLTTQRQLLSDVSHELRSPLARLNVALALARQRSGPEAAAPLDRIEAEAEQLNALIGRVLELARLESGAAPAERAPVDLGRLLEDIAADADFEARAKDCTVTFSAAEPCRVLGSEPLLRSAFENVVRNAVRYTARGTGVEIEMAPAGGGAVVTVRDHGPGVAEEHLDDMFEPFYRLADARDRESGGTGLGLAITRRAIRLHGGTVQAANAEDGGLIVELRLPPEPPA